MKLAQTIYDNWLDLRANGRLDAVLPSARAWPSGDGSGGVRGYDTCEHQVNRQVSIPGSGPSGGTAIAGLVETYYSIRRQNGPRHNLHVHVVDVKNEILQVSHLAQLFRHVAAIRFGLSQQEVRLGSWSSTDRHLYVHGALLGPVASGDVLMAEAMLDKQYDHMENGLMDAPVRVGCVSLHPSEGISITRIRPDINYSADWVDDSDGKRPHVEEVVNSLLHSGSMWTEWIAAREAEANSHDVRARDERASAVAEGELKGRRDVLLRLLAQAEIGLTDLDCSDIEACADGATLDRWIDNVQGAKIAADVLC